jgi:hypothetical protein
LFIGYSQLLISIRSQYEEDYQQLWKYFLLEERNPFNGQNIEDFLQKPTTKYPNFLSELNKV